VNGTGSQFDVIVIGGGPAGSILGSLLAQRGRSCLVLERDIHPRDHVGESLTPSTNPIFKQIGFLEKIEAAGFVHKPGACWTAPRAPAGKFVSIRLGDFPPPDATQQYTYNVERDVFDALLIRHAHELGARVIQGAGAQQVLFERDRAVGVRARLADGAHHDFYGRFVIDASGRRCVLGNQLGFKHKDPEFDQVAMYSWFKGVAPNPPGYEGFLFLHFLGLERAWAWQIPLRDGVCSIGVVTHRSDFKRAEQSPDEFFASAVARSVSFGRAMEGAERIRPWWLEGDYSYRVDRLAGPGWLIIGDALRFIDPIFSTGVDVAAYSAKFAFEALEEALSGGDEAPAWATYERRVSDGVDVWYQFTSLFYKLQNLFTLFAVRERYREQVVRILQGNPYMPESLERAREMISLMQESYGTVMRQPGSLLRPGALNGTGHLSATVAVDALVASVLGPGGATDPAWREAAYQRGRAFARGASEAEARTIGRLPAPVAQLVFDLARTPHGITDEGFEALYAAGYSAESLLEITFAAAVGTGVERRTLGMEAIEAWEATTGNREATAR
jgi:1H-pyrrole-2-carbonyl-[peptidyl-carrier protein] chlorinase